MKFRITENRIEFRFRAYIEQESKFGITGHTVCGLVLRDHAGA